MIGKRRRHFLTNWIMNFILHLIHVARPKLLNAKNTIRQTVFCNPPYGKDLPKWIEKCANESKHAKVVMLIPARTDTIAFHKYIYNKAEIRFIKGRLKFRVDGKEGDPAPFPSMVVIFP